MNNKTPKNQHPLVFEDIPQHLSNEEVEAIRAKYQRYQRGYDGEDKLADVLSNEDYIGCCKELTEGVVELAGVKPDDHRECFEACVGRCVSSKVLGMRTWSKWSGYRRFAELVKDAAAYTRETHMIYLPYAPVLVAAIAVRTLRSFEPRPGDEITPLITDLKMFDRLQGIIKC
ncbi:hypothetical protein A9Z42_0015600 [Trichoderma parareesei]|uniref:Uncharacterized protein n=1 Tax=Trichoderma parareesei TaxID=858221 RepID=A0A2H2YZQ4_TRIPA|nr:hypothetical protein A9Z42_0015600 [Trichoderma parareesei]